MPYTGKSEQELINTLLSNSPLNGKSVQDALSDYYGYTRGKYSFQEILAIKSGVSPLTSRTAQQMLYTNLQPTLNLTAPFQQYSEQQLLQLAADNGIGIDTIMAGAQTLSSYIQSISGLVAYYPLNETSGVAINQAPATLGTLNGTVTEAIQGVAGQSGTAYSFDGVNDKVAITDNNVIDFTTVFSLFAIVKPSSFGTVSLGQIINKSGGFPNGYTLSLRNNAAQSTWRAGFNNTTFEASANGIVLDTWQLVGFTYDSSLGSLNVKHYRNGAAWGTNNTTVSASTTAENLSLNGTDRFFPGLIQHAMLFNTVVTPAQILTIAQLAGLA